MALDTQKEANRGLKININTIKVLCINGQNIEGVDRLLYLGSVTRIDGGTEFDVARRISST